MKTTAFFLATLALAIALPLDLIEDDEGQQYLLVPLQRQRRESSTSWDVSKGAAGTTVKLGQETVLASKGGHELNAGAFASKTFDPTGPLTVGGTLGYHNVPTGTDVKAVVAQTPNWGTDVGLQASKTLWAPDKNTKLEAYGGVSQSFTPWGKTKPEANVGLQFSHGHNWFSG
ncbi:uncharacterized protein LOC109608154 isoform X1 [Aethina tumida]|uniref:uncharacterized protein LOC109608154 isoform X1 n=1 Tax=Aethina tumida TaxID=116153 RepID=UPI0021481862|nr:uncharacterized protein LOC109608154 isoform X1 [Aethina tumida]